LIEIAMRFAGASLLVIGFLLCVSIAWAAIGFFAMGFGLICLLIAEERKNASALHLEKTEIQPSPIEAPQPVTARIRLANDDIPREVALREMDKWSSLLESDQDLSRVAKILAPFGQKYVDQLARAYAAFDDKTYLPLILNMIIESARQDAALSAASKLETDNSIAIRNDQNSVDASRAHRFSEFRSIAKTHESSSRERELHRSSQQKPASCEISGARVISDGVPAEAVPPASPQPPIREDGFDEVDNLKDLLNILDLPPSRRP
jgi:hypothetical protein